MSMVRKQVFITAEQNRQLKAHARATGQAEAELIRSALDREFGFTDATEEWKSQLLRIVEDCKGGDFEGLATRVAEERQRQRELWARRAEETRRKLSDM
ncbi:MAG: hypothetical protein SH859_14895 [Hyphomicrobium aestuarii]|nr:hypothetical protein [Hyphomicrobium aestuarii]